MNGHFKQFQTISTGQSLDFDRHHSQSGKTCGSRWYISSVWNVFLFCYYFVVTVVVAVVVVRLFKVNGCKWLNNSALYYNANLIFTQLPFLLNDLQPVVCFCECFVSAHQERIVLTLNCFRFNAFSLHYLQFMFWYRAHRIYP